MSTYHSSYISLGDVLGVKMAYIFYLFLNVVEIYSI